MSTPRRWLEYTIILSARAIIIIIIISIIMKYMKNVLCLHASSFVLPSYRDGITRFFLLHCIALHFSIAERESKPESLQQVLLVVNRKETSFWPLLLLLLLPILLVSSASPRPMHATEHTPIQVKPRHQPSKQPTINLPSGIHSRHQTP